MKKYSVIIIILILFSQVNIFSQGFICAIGGGSENYNDWSDEPYHWIVEKSDSGKILILSYSDASNWIPNYFESLGSTEAYNFKIDTKNKADLQSTYDEIISADAVFIKGGDQSKYVNLWNDTKTEEAIMYVYNNGGVIAGTSAGEAILGDVDYAARHSGSLVSREALRNPFINEIDLEDNFLDLVPNVLFDSHFIQRGRSGRLIAMLYNFITQNNRNILGIGVDDKTTFCIDDNGIGEVMGSGAVAIFQKDNKTFFSEYDDGYTIENLKCDQLVAGWKYDLINKEIIIPAFAKKVDTLRNWLFPKTDLWFTGHNHITSQLNNNFSDFLSAVNITNIVVISHPGYELYVSQITDYLNENNLNFDLVYLTDSNLEDNTIADVFNSASCFVFSSNPDSLDILTLLNQTNKVVSQVFNNKIENHTPLFSFGTSGKVSGKNYVNGILDDPYASYYGELTNNDGINIFGDLIFQPMLYDDADFYENRTTALLWGLMRNRKRFGVYLDGLDMVKINYDENTIYGKGDLPLFIVNASKTIYVDSSKYIDDDGSGPRQVVAMNNLRYSITTYNNLVYKLEDGKFDFTSSTKNHESINPQGFKLFQNYPNPFNPSTIIKFSISEKGSDLFLENGNNAIKTKLIVYNVLGKEISTLVNEEKFPGNYEVNFDASSLSSGIYFYKLLAGNYSQTKPMVLLK